MRSQAATISQVMPVGACEEEELLEELEEELEELELEEELEELEGAEVELLGVGVGTGAEDSASPQAAKRPAVERSNSTVLILFTLKTSVIFEETITRNRLH